MTSSVVSSDPFDSGTSQKYLTFDPCQHLKQVVSTQARSTALRNYKLALKVSLLNSAKEAKYRDAESSDVIDHSSLLDMRSKLLKCRICSTCTGSLFMCLQCNHIGCFHKGHAFSHAKSAGHVFGIDSMNGNLFCFRCRDFVGHPDLEELRLQHLAQLNGTGEWMSILTHFKSVVTNYRVKVSGSKHFENETEDDSKIYAQSRVPSFKATSGLRGFVNMGATCFMSSIIQTLIHNPLVRNHFLAGKHINCMNDPTDCIPCCLDEIFTIFYTQDETNGFGPTSLLTAAWKVKRSLAGYSEQDAHEFWQFIMDELHKSDLQLLESGAKDGDDNFRKSHSPHSSTHDCPCITHRTFSGLLQSTIKCSKCESMTKTVDMMLDLSLEIAQNQVKKVAGKTLPVKSLKLADCLSRFTTPEKLDVLYSCDTCGHKTMAFKQLQIKKLPPVLGIQLKRFEHSSVSSKIETHVEFPLILDMNDYVLHEAGDEKRTLNHKSHKDLTYELFAVVCHIGSVNTGHYICMAKNRDGNWFKFDDSAVNLVPSSEVLGARPYLLYYIVRDLD